MPQSTTCPTCGKRFAVKAEVLGRRVKCPGCGEPFVVEADEALSVSHAAVTAPAVAGVRAYTPRPAAKEPWIVPPDQWSDRQTFWFRIGLLFVAMGLTAGVMPLLGVQWKIIGHASDPVYVGLIWAAIGGAVSVLAAMGRLGKWLILSALGLAGLLILLLVVVVVIHVNARSHPAAAPPPPPSPRGPARPNWAANPSGPGGRPASDIPKGDYPGGRFVDGYDGMVSTYGADKVVRVILRTPDYKQIAALARSMPAVARAVGAEDRVDSLRATHADWALAPVSDAAKVAAQLGVPADQVQVDANAHAVTLTLPAMTAVPTTRPSTGASKVP